MNYKFSQNVVKNTDFLNRLARTKSNRIRHALILEATPDQILSIVEICANILGSHFILNKQQKNRLAKYADYYRSIARSKSEKTARQKIYNGINQEGGQLAIATLLAPVLSTIAQSLLDKAFQETES